VTACPPAAAAWPIAADAACLVEFGCGRSRERDRRALGLTEPAHFSRLFQAAYGIPLVEYRLTMGKAASLSA
jgi:hypothetical protein